MAKRKTARKGKNPGKGAFKRCVAAVSKRKGIKSPGGVCATIARKKYGAMAKAGKAHANRKNAGRRHNSVEKSADVYREFHGKDPADVTEFKIVKREHQNYSGVGKLVELVISPVSGERKFVHLTNFRGALLAQSESGTQLYIVGGDQAVNLREFGITDPHESELLGACVRVSYDTEKKHLTPETGGKAVYDHKFGSGKSRLPVIIYDVMNKTLAFSGGGYEMPPEGIHG